jgi:hypothetical protein
VERDFLAKRSAQLGLPRRKTLVEPGHPQLSLVRQCQLLGVSRSSLYYQPVGPTEEECTLLRLIDEQYLKTPVLWQSSHDGSLAPAGVLSQSQTGQAVDASTGAASDLSQAQAESASPRTQGLSVLAQRGRYRRGQSSLEHRYYLSASPQGPFLPGGDYGLV